VGHDASCECWQLIFFDVVYVMNVSTIPSKLVHECLVLGIDDVFRNFRNWAFPRSYALLKFKCHVCLTDMNFEYEFVHFSANNFSQL